MCHAKLLFGDAEGVDDLLDDLLGRGVLSLESFLDDCLVLVPLLGLVVLTSALDAFGAEALGSLTGGGANVLEELEEVLLVQRAIWRLLDVSEVGCLEFLGELAGVSSTGGSVLVIISRDVVEQKCSSDERANSGKSEPECLVIVCFLDHGDISRAT